MDVKAGEKRRFCVGSVHFTLLMFQEGFWHQSNDFAATDRIVETAFVLRQNRPVGQ